jgi:translation initiation factor 1
MAKKNWKEILVITLANNLNNQEPDPEKKIDNKVREIQQELIIRFEKRNGKPATIISNFKGSKSDLKDLAGKLKKHCCTGGSAKDDEILIQGDVRNDVADFLRNIGHKVRGDFKK